MEDQKPKKIVVKDAHLLDKKIPRNLILKYGDNYHILKAGLEWKAMQIYGVGGYSLETEIVERNEKYVLAKATLTTKEGVKFSNFGEASMLNVINRKMQPYLLHLAVTRAECRVLRMATACGYVSREEIVGSSFNESLPEPEVVEKVAGAVKTNPLPEKNPTEKTAEVKSLSSVDIVKMRKELK